MTETPESTVATPETVLPAESDHRHHRPSRLYQTLAWVGIIAGVLFIVAMIFFSGVFLGRMSGGYHGWHRGHPNGSMDCPMMEHGGMMGPGGMGHGGMMGPGGMDHGGMMGPGQPPSSATPMPPFTQRPS